MISISFNMNTSLLFLLIFASSVLPSDGSVAPLKVTRHTGYSDGLLDNMSDMQKTGMLTDFVIKVQKLSLKSHKVVLSAASPYFKWLFEPGVNKGNGYEMSLYNMNKQAVENIIHYIYGREIVIQYENIKDYLRIVDSFRLDYLHNQIDLYVSAFIHLGNAVQWYVLAHRYRLKETSERARRVLKTDFLAAGLKEDFVALSIGEVVQLISDEIISGGDRDAILKACINWVLADEAFRKRYFTELLSHIDIEQCSGKYLNDNEKHLITDVKTRTRITPIFTSNNLTSDVDKFVLFGGFHKNGEPNTDIYTIDPHSKTLEKKSLPEILVRDGPARCITKTGKVFSAGGQRQNGSHWATSSASLLDPITHEISQLPRLPHPVWKAAAVCDENKVYVIGGHHAENLVQCLDLGSKTWSRLEDLEGDEPGLIAWKTNHIGVMRFPNEGENRCIQRYDARYHIWHQTCIAPGGDVHGSFAVVEGNKVFIIGSEEKAFIYFNDQLFKSWSTPAQPIEQHRWGSGVYANGRIIVSGGWNNGRPTDTIEEYDIARKKWKKSSFKLPIPLSSHFTVII